MAIPAGTQPYSLTAEGPVRGSRAVKWGFGWNMNYLLGAVDKFDEAAFFCRQIDGDPDHAAYHVNAFAAAAYAIWECLAKLCMPEPIRIEECRACHRTTPVLPEDNPAWQWYKKAKSDATKKNRIGRYFQEGRSADVHAGAGFVNGYAVSVWLDGQGEVSGQTRALLREADRAGFPDGITPVEACEDYLASLVRIFTAGYEQFRQAWDHSGEIAGAVKRLSADWAGKVH